MCLDSSTHFIPKVVLVFPKGDNVVFLLKNIICFLLQALPIHRRTYLCAEILEGDARPCSRVWLSKLWAWTSRGSDSYAVTRRDGIHFDCQMLPGDGFILYDKLSICGCQLAPCIIEQPRTFCVSASKEEFLPWSQPEFLACMTLSNWKRDGRGAVPLKASPSFSRTHISSSFD